MKTTMKRDAITTINTHYIDGAFVESHGREVMDIIRPTDRQIIGRVTLADEKDTRRAIAAAKRAFTSFGGSTKEDRAEILRRLHEAFAARIDDLTDAMVEEYGAPAVFVSHRQPLPTAGRHFTNEFVSLPSLSFGRLSRGLSRDLSATPPTFPPFDVVIAFALVPNVAVVYPWQRDELPAFGGTNLFGDANLLLEGPRSGRR